MCFYILDATLGSCVSCKVEGKAGDGAAQGTCSADLRCHVDGSCSVCSSTAKGDGVTPQSGCTDLNPTCKSDKSGCVCKDDTDPANQVTCDSGTASKCDLVTDPTTPTCTCGTNPACSGGTPICDTSSGTPTCSKCTVGDAKADGDGTAQGTCPEGNKCHSDGSCSVCTSDIGAGTMGDAHSGCTNLNPSCNTDDANAHKCECAADVTCNSATATVCDTGACKCGTTDCAAADPPTPICDQTTDPTTPTCAKCNVNGSDGDGKAQGTCPTDTDKCHSNGACAVCISTVGSGTAADPHSGCSTDSTKPKCNTDADPVCEAAA